MLICLLVQTIPVLFPIVGTVKDNKYLYDNKSYHLERHGFAREMEFAAYNQQVDLSVSCWK